MLISVLMLLLFLLASVALLAAGISGFLLLLPLSLVRPVPISTGLNRRKRKLLLPLLFLSLILICSLLFFSNFFLRSRVISFVLSRDSVLTAFPRSSRVSVPSLPARIGFFEPYAGSCRVVGSFLPLKLIFRSACSYGCLWAFIHNLFKNFLTFSFYCVIFFLHEGHLNLRLIPFVNFGRNFLLLSEKGEVRL